MLFIYGCVCVSILYNHLKARYLAIQGGRLPQKHYIDYVKLSYCSLVH